MLPTLTPFFFPIPPGIRRCVVQDMAYFDSHLLMALTLYSADGSARVAILAADNPSGPWRSCWHSSIEYTSTKVGAESGFRRFMLNDDYLLILLIHQNQSRLIQINRSLEVSFPIQYREGLSQPIGLINRLGDYWIAAPLYLADRQAPSLFATQNYSSEPWYQITEPGLGDCENTVFQHLYRWGDKLMVSVFNPMNGFQLWQGTVLLRSEMNNDTGLAHFCWQKILDQGAMRYTESPSIAAITPSALDTQNLLIATGMPPFERRSAISPASEIIRLSDDESQHWQLLMGTMRFSPLGLQRPLSGLGDNFGNSSGNEGISALFADNTGVFAAVFHPEQPFTLWFSRDEICWQSLTHAQKSSSDFRSLRQFISTPWGLLASGTWQGNHPASPAIWMIQ